MVLRLERPRVYQAALILMVIAIYYMPALPGLLRPEDYLTPFAFLVIALSGSIGRSPFTSWALVYPAYCFFVTLIGIAFFALSPDAIIVFLKQGQYYILLILAELSIRVSRHPGKTAAIALSMITYASIFSFIASVLIGEKGYYGIDFWNERNGPSNSALAYSAGVSSGFILSRTNILEDARLRSWYGFLMYLCIGFLILVGTRTAVVTGAFWLFASIVSRPAKGSNYGKLIRLENLRWLHCILGFTFLALALASVGSDLLLLQEAMARVFHRSLSLVDFYDTLNRSRGSIWSEDFKRFMRESPIFGCGLGCSARSEDQILKLQGDSQYLRMLIESGVIGTLFWLIGIIRCVSLLAPGVKGAYVVFVCGFFIMGVTQEVFLLSKGGQAFWLVTGLLLGLRRFGRQSGW